MPSATASSAAVARPWSSRWAMTSSARDWPALPGLALQRSLASCSVTAVAGSGCGSWSATALSTTHSPLRCTRQRFPAGAVRAAREREASAGLAAASRQTERRASVPTGPSSQTKRNSYDGRGRGPGIGDALITPTRGRRTLCSGYMTVRAHLGAGRPASVSLVRSATGAVGIAAALAALYKHVLRKPILNWGATDEEASARMPGDEFLEHADGVLTRAIDIDAPPLPSGRGWLRWARLRGAAPTRMTGSRTCWGSTCAAPPASFRSSNTRRSVTRSAWAPTE